MRTHTGRYHYLWHAVIVSGLAPILLSGCITVPISPRARFEPPPIAQKIPASVAVVLDPSFSEARVDERVRIQKTTRTAKVLIGESSVAFLKLALPAIFESVGFVQSEAEGKQYDFVMVPRIQYAWGGLQQWLADSVSATVGYAFEFKRPMASQLVASFLVSGTGTYDVPGAMNFLHGMTALTFGATEILGYGPGTQSSIVLSRAFEEAQRQAFSRLIGEHQVIENCLRGERVCLDLVLDVSSY